MLSSEKFCLIYFLEMEVTVCRKPLINIIVIWFDCPRSAVRKVRREVRDLRLVCAPLHPRQDLRRVQLRILSGCPILQLRYLPYLTLPNLLGHPFLQIEVT